MKFDLESVKLFANARFGHGFASLRLCFRELHWSLRYPKMARDDVQ